MFFIQAVIAIFMQKWPILTYIFPKMEFTPATPPHTHTLLRTRECMAFCGLYSSQFSLMFWHNFLCGFSFSLSHIQYVLYNKCIGMVISLLLCWRIAQFWVSSAVILIFTYRHGNNHVFTLANVFSCLLVLYFAILCLCTLVISVMMHILMFSIQCTFSFYLVHFTVY